MKLKAFDYSALGQSLLDIAIKGGVFVALLLLNYVSAGLSGGTWQLPYPAVTLPVLTILVSQLDSYFVAWAEKDNVPVPVN